ncbi:MAG: ice-binding family protein [Candidatus Eisenbacteria bacterium]|nr:ice-binding family protein [Candidatus Eisenbacteria bacterium]
MQRFNRNALWLTALLPALMMAGCQKNAATLVGPSDADPSLTQLSHRPPARSPVNLGTAANYVILSKSGISTTGTTSIVGKIGVSPIAATAITGFGLVLDSSGSFSNSSLVTGRVYAADYAVPTPATLTRAVSNMETAYTDAAGRTLPDYTELGAGNIGGLTLRPGLYKWSSTVTIPTDVTLSGSPTDVWIFQIAQTLAISSGKQIILRDGAKAKNVFWQVAGQTTLGTTSKFKGILLCKTAIVIQNGATLNGRALAQTAVTLDANSITAPAF